MRKTFLFILALCAASAVWGEMTTGPVTYASIAKQNGWTTNSYNQTLDWGGAISVTAKWDGSTKNGKSIDNTSWRIYQKNLKGEFAINAKPGFIIKTIKLTYATNNKGVCSKTANASPSTTATAAGDQITSKTVYTVNASSITLYVGVTEATTASGDITISLQTIEVTYDYDFADSYLTEKFQTPDGTDWNFGTSTSGTTIDGKYYTWEHGNIRYNNQAMDVLQNGAKAVEMRNAPDAYFQTVAEGGVKYISFCWNQAGADESSYPAEKLILSVGDESETQTIVGQAAANRCGDRLFSFFPVTSGKTNATIKLSNLDANRIIFGPITIVPYLLFTQKTAEVDALEENSYTYPADKLINNTEDGTVTYSITSNSGATINAATGEVNLTTVTSAATDTITATWGEVTTTYSLTISYTAPAEGTYWKEGFSNFKAEGYTGYTTDIEGDYGIVWIARNFRHKTSDNSDKVAGEYGVRLNYAAKDANKDGYIETSSLEGGVKRLQFKWKTPSNSENPKFTVEFDGKVLGDTVKQEQAAADAGTVYDFGYNANIAKNAKFTIRVTNGTCASIFGPLTIVPYLFYTTKSHTIDNATIGGIYTNTELINNIDEGTVTYSLISEGADEIAEIDAATGEVTVKAGGVVTVQAKWVPDATKQDEFVTTTYELTINFPQPTITFNDIEVALDGTVTPDITVKLSDEDITETATISYEVADENIATWDATNGWKLKTNGFTQVTANVERTAQYGAASATATMTVNTMTFAEGTFFTENFGGETTSSYSTQTEDWRGKDNVYPWTFLNWRRYADHVRITMTKPGSSNINGYIYMNPFDDDALEGGIKAVQVTWSAPGAETLATDFYVDDIKNTQATKVTIQKEAGTISGQQITQAIFNSKTDKAQLRIRIGSLDKSAIDVYSVDIVPYLLYTKKEVSVTYDLEGTNEVDVTANLINNLEAGETVTYSLSDGAQATIDGSTITLANATEDVIVTAKCGDVPTTFTLKVTKAEDPEPEPDFVLENKTAGAISTICLPKKIASVENATLYSISYGNTSAIEFVEADFENDAAGMPYLVQVTADGDVNFYYSEGDAVTEPVSAVDAKGFVGKLAADDPNSPTYVPEDGSAIIITRGQLHIAGAWCVLTQNHAYIDSYNLPGSAAPVVGAPRRTIRLYNPDMAPTNLVESESESGKAMKVLRDGQFYIIRDTKTYNAQGILVE